MIRPVSCAAEYSRAFPVTQRGRHLTRNASGTRFLLGYSRGVACLRTAGPLPGTKLFLVKCPASLKCGALATEVPTGKICHRERCQKFGRIFCQHSILLCRCAEEPGTPAEHLQLWPEINPGHHVSLMDGRTVSCYAAVFRGQLLR